MYFDHVRLPLLSWLLLDLPPLPHPLPVCAAEFSGLWGQPLEHGQPPSGHNLKENGLSFPRKPSTPHSSSVRGESSWTPSHSMLVCWWAWFGGAYIDNHCGLMNAAILAYPKDTVSHQSSPASGSYRLCPFCYDGAWALEKGSSDDPFVREHDSDTYSMHSDQLWVPV